MKEYFADHPFLPIMQLHMQLLFDLHDSQANQAPSHESLSTSHFWLLHQQWKLPLPGLLLAPLATHMPLPKITFKSLSHFALVWMREDPHMFQQKYEMKIVSHLSQKIFSFTSIRAMDSKIPCRYSTSFSGRGWSLPKNSNLVMKMKSLSDLFRLSFQKIKNRNKLYFLLWVKIDLWLS